MKITNIDTLGISTFVFTHKKTTLYKITTEIYKSQKHFFYLNPILKTTLCIRVNHYAKRDDHHAKRDYHYVKRDNQYAKRDYHYAKRDDHYAKRDYHYVKRDNHYVKRDYHYAKRDYHYAKRDYHYAKRDYLCKGVSLKMFSLLTLSNPVRDISCFTTSTFPL